MGACTAVEIFSKQRRAAVAEEWHFRMEVCVVLPARDFRVIRDFKHIGNTLVVVVFGGDRVPTGDIKCEELVVMVTHNQGKTKRFNFIRSTGVELANAAIFEAIFLQ